MVMRRAFLTVLSSVMLVTACSQAQPLKSAAPLAAETVTFGGSGAGYPGIKLLAAAYAKTHGELHFEFLAGSTGDSGMSMMRAGTVDVAVLSRTSTAVENQDKTIRYVAVASDAIAVVVNPSVGLVDLSTSQLRDLYTGKIKTWGQLNVAGDEVTLLDRPEDETAKIVMRVLFGPDLAIDRSAVQLAKESDMVTAVQRTAGAIGFFSSSLLAATPSIGHAIRIDGIAPDVNGIRSGNYRAIRTVTIAMRVPTAERTSLAGFLSYLGTREAADLLLAAGYAPLP